MIIGFDLDEVLCGLFLRINKYLIDEHDFWINYKEDMVSYKMETLACIPKAISKDMFSHIEDGSFFKEATPTAYAEHAINKLRIAGFRIFIITHRREDFREVTEKWLDDNNLYYDVLFMGGSVYPGDDDKSKIINKYNIEAMVDDRHDVLSEIYRKCKPLKYGLYCIDVPWSKRFYNDNIIKVKDVAEAADKIVDLKGRV